MASTITQSFMKLLFLVLALGSTFCGSEEEKQAVAPEVETPFATPTQVLQPTKGDSLFAAIDGDTVDVQIDTHLVRIRIKGINTPEIFTHPPEPYGPEAATFTRQFVGNSVTLTYDSGCPTPAAEKCLDQYQRHLAYVTLADGSD